MMPSSSHIKGADAVCKLLS